jgi:hypothetical protein
MAKKQKNSITVEKIHEFSLRDDVKPNLKRPTRWIDQYRFNAENGCLEKYTIEVVVNFPWEDEQVTITNEGNEDAGNSGISD